jgi:magnesium transporter
MEKNVKNTNSKKAGLSPGAPVYIGADKSKPIDISEINFSEKLFEEKRLNNISESKAFKMNKKSTTWINVDGVHDAASIESIGTYFKLDPLVIEDILNTAMRPKFEDLDDYLFFSLKMIRIDEKEEIINEQLSLILGKNWILSIDANEKDIFSKYRGRLKSGKGITRGKQADFVFYRLIDIVVDNYFYLTEYLDDQIEKLEEKTIENSDKNIASEIYKLKKKVSDIKKSIFPLREAVSAIIRSDSDLIDETNGKFFKDLYDHVVQLNDTIETQRETINDFLNLYMAGVSNKMNDVMKVLTMFSAVFIPLTFIAGLYGMNFDNIPELHWKYGYFITLIVMFIVLIGMIINFKRKKWL